MATERTIEIRGSAGAAFTRRTLEIDFLPGEPFGRTFELTLVRITPSIEHALNVEFGSDDKDFSGRILIDKDET
jgi:hypothetical protein